MRILAVIPARSGSKGIPGKNLCPLAGKPLIAYSIEAALACPLIHRVVVSSDSEEIGRVAERYHAIFQRRPAELATDLTPMEPVVRHCMEVSEREDGSFDAVLLLQPTSPLRSSDDINQAIRIFLKKPCDTLLSVFPFHGYRYQIKNELCRPLYRKRRNRQDRGEEYVENGAIYLTRAEFIRKEKILGKHLCAYVMPARRSIDIDTADDLFLAEAIYTLTNSEPHKTT